MLTEVFNKHVTSILPTELSTLDRLCMAAHCLQGNNKMAIIGCKALIEISQKVGEQYDLDLIDLAGDTLVKKAKEYAIAGDRLANFKCRYPWQEQWSRGRLLGYLEKHLTSCADILSGQLTPTKDLILDKFGDCLNYACLLYALLNEDTND